MIKAWYLAGVTLLALTACAGGDKNTMQSAAPAAKSEGPNIVNVSATEYRFEMPDTLPAGPTLFRFTDNGAQLHHMTIVRFKQGKTLADFTALPPNTPPPAWVVFMGGPNTPTPHGGMDEDMVDLSPGNYAVICVIPGPDGKPHFMSGMVKALTVTPSTRIRTMPVGDLTLTLSDYTFTFSSPPAAGDHALAIVNNGTQPHEAVLFRLMQGKKGEDISNWVAAGMKGPPPAAPVTGISALTPGRENLLPLTLTPGDYALLCFVPDAKDGKYHAMHGMIHDFKVI